MFSGCHGNGSRNKSKQHKISISLILKCDLSQANTHVDICMAIKKLPCSWPIHAIIFVLGLNTNDNNTNAVSIHNMA